MRDDQRPESDLLTTSGVRLASDVLRSLTGDNDPVGERDELMSLEEHGGPFVKSILPIEMGAPDDTEALDETWEREAFPTPMGDDDAIDDEEIDRDER